MKKWLLIVIVIIIVGFVGYKIFASKSNSQQTTSQIRTATVQKGNLEVKVSGSGTIQAITSEDIKSTINNNAIDEVLVKAGEKVKKGETLITFTDGSDPITAPEYGVVTTVAVSPGERVSTGQVVAHLTNYNHLQTIVQIDELDIPKLKTGQTVTLKVNAYPDKTYTGKVTAIANEGATTNGVSSFDVTIKIDDTKNLKVGMTTEASILTASKNNALLVPLEAIHTMNNQKFVILASDSQNQNSGRQQTIVKTGLVNEDFVEITEGLTEGQIVRLPQLATSTSNTNYSQRMMGGGFGGVGGMNRGNRSGGGSNTGGRSGNE